MVADVGLRRIIVERLAGLLALREKLDLSAVTIPIYELATREDHIAPAKSVFTGAKFFGGPVRCVLAGPGHIAGVVNPPDKPKYQYWTGPAPGGRWTVTKAEGARRRAGRLCQGEAAIHEGSLRRGRL